MSKLAEDLKVHTDAALVALRDAGKWEASIEEPAPVRSGGFWSYVPTWLRGWLGVKK